MRLKTLVTCVGLVACTGLAGMSVSAHAQGAALSGQVSSTEEGAMEGVLVSAKKEGSTITTTVVTNDKGQLQLPGRIGSSRASTRITIRAGGYTLVGPEERRRRGRDGRDRRHQARQGPQSRSRSSPTPSG